MIYSHEVLDDVREQFNITRTRLESDLFDRAYVNPDCKNFGWTKDKELYLGGVCFRELALGEIIAQRAAIRGITRIHIAELGLTNSVQTIIDDMNHNKIDEGRVFGEEMYPIRDFDDFRFLVRAVGDQLLAERSAYIDRWKMYNELFGKDSKFE